jgi:hypothetical protein
MLPPAKLNFRRHGKHVHTTVKAFCSTIQFVFNGSMIHVNASIKCLIGNNKKSILKKKNSNCLLNFADV